MQIDEYRLKLLKQKLDEEELKIKVTVLNKSFWTNKDIAIMMDCARTKASKYRAKIVKYMESEGKEKPTQIPSKLAIKVLDINEADIRKNYKFILEVRRSENSQKHFDIAVSERV